MFAADGSNHVSELRLDPIVQRWVVMAPERAQRPQQITDVPRLVETGVDPFAEGNEAATPSELLAYRNSGSTPNGPGWRVRVVPNKFPAMRTEGFPDPHSDGLHHAMNGVGSHELIIECPQSESNLSRLSSENIREVLTAYRDRLCDLKRDRRLAHAMIFKNHGALAGASVRHSHSQLLATPFVPMAVREELAGALEYQQGHGRNIFAEMLQQELESGSRIVIDAPRFVAFCPYASRLAYETWILPRQPGSHYEQIDDSAAGELAAVLKGVLLKLDVSLDDPAYNYVLHSAPLQAPELPHYRWHIEVLPRLNRIAGFEWGSGNFINEVLPELAAARLRGSVID